MAQSTRQTFGVPSQGMLFESSDKVMRLSEARHTYEARLGELEQQFELKAAKVREEYLAAVLEIHAPEANETALVPKTGSIRIDRDREGRPGKCA
jgi:hypothetical protein